MPWTAPTDRTTGDIITAAEWNSLLGASGDMALTATGIVTTQGDMVYATAANTLARLAKGTAYQALQMNAGATAPSWQASPTSTLTTTGDLLYSSSANTLARVAIGSTGQALTVSGGLPSWQASPTSTLTTTGDLLYSSSANTLARIAIGSAAQVLTVSGGVPAWSAPSTGTLTSLIQSFVEDGVYKALSSLGTGHYTILYSENDKIGLGFRVVKNGSASIIGSDPTALGGWLLTTGSTAGSTAGFFAQGFRSTDDWTMVGRVALNTAAAQSVIFGVSLTSNFDVTQNGIIGFRVSNTGTLVAVCDSGGTETTRDTGFTPNGAEQSLRIEVRSGGTIVRFYRNGTQVGADVTTNIMTGDGIVQVGMTNLLSASSSSMKVFDVFAWREV